MHVDGRRDGPVGVVGLRERGAEDGHDSIADELHDGAGLAENRLVHSGAVSAKLARELARVGMLGDGRVGPDVAHQHGHDDPLGLADRPRLLPELLGKPAGQQPG